MLKMLLFFCLISGLTFANYNDLSKELLNKIETNNKNSKVSFVIFDLDKVLITKSPRYEYLFNKYLKKYPSKAIKTYFDKKNFFNVPLLEVLNDLDNLKISKRTKERVKKFLKDNYNSEESFEHDMALYNSVEFVNGLYEKRAFIVYLTSLEAKYLPLTIKVLNKSGFPVGKSRTMIISSVNKGNVVKNIYDFVNMGEIVSFFSADKNYIDILKPYLKGKLFFVSESDSSSEDYKVIKGLKN